MDENENGVVDASGQAGEETVEVSVEELQAELAKAKEIAENQRIRAEKAEKKTKEEDKPKDTPAPNKEAADGQNLSSKDILALSVAGIAEEEDVDYLTTTAKGFGMTVSQALTDPIIKAKLEERQEERKTAAATNTKGGVASGNTKPDDSSLVANAGKGKLPESEADMARLAKARRRKL